MHSIGFRGIDLKLFIMENYHMLVIVNVHTPYTCAEYGYAQHLSHESLQPLIRSIFITIQVS